MHLPSLFTGQSEWCLNTDFAGRKFSGRKNGKQGDAKIEADSHLRMKTKRTDCKSVRPLPCKWCAARHDLRPFRAIIGIR